MVTRVLIRDIAGKLRMLRVAHLTFQLLGHSAEYGLHTGRSGPCEDIPNLSLPPPRVEVFDKRHPHTILDGFTYDLSSCIALRESFKRSVFKFKPLNRD